MFLSKKSVWKIAIVASIYFILGSICMALAYLAACWEVDSNILYLGIALYCLCPLLIFSGYYAEGKGEFINLGNKLVRRDLKPAAFIKEYEALKNSTDLVINKPSFEILHMIVVAYDILDDRENALATANDMIATASKKKKTLAKLHKASLLFSYDMTEEAEALFFEAQNSQLNFACQALMDSIWKSDRAIAMGDYKTAERYCLTWLSQKFPKPDNLGKLVIHCMLGEIYEKLQDTKQAIPHYQYCVVQGGETAIRESAKAALERLA